MISLQIDTQQLPHIILSELTRSNHIAYAHIDKNLIIQTVSESLNAIVDSDAQTIVGQSITEAVLEFFGTEAMLTAVLHGEQPVLRFNRVLRETHDTTTYYAFRLTQLQFGMPEAGLLLLVENVTTQGVIEQAFIQERNELRLVRQKLQAANVELLRLDRLKSLFLSMAAHDLRTPLAGVTGFANILQHKQKAIADEKDAYYINQIIEQTTWMDQLIANMLDLERIEQGQFAIRSSSINLNEVIRKSATLLQPIIDSRGLQFELTLPAETIRINADPKAIERILFNLVGNAVKYAGHKSLISINVDASDSIVDIIVSDNGRGMSPEQLKKMFTIFYRSEVDQDSERPGTGLGMFIVQSLVEAHNGYIKADSELGVGTTITISLPLI